MACFDSSNAPIDEQGEEFSFPFVYFPSDYALKMISYGLFVSFVIGL